MVMTSKNLNDLYQYQSQDIEIIRCQLEVERVYVAGIIERCKYGYPSVFLICPCASSEFNTLEPDKKKIELYQSMANVIWLSCPYLNRKIHALESAGKIRSIKKFIQSDRELIEQMNGAHAHYYFLRKHVYNHFCGEAITENNNDLFNLGIGGIKDTNNIKCLHMHYAHYRLYKQNSIGRIVETLLDHKIYCEETECKKCRK